MRVEMPLRGLVTRHKSLSFMAVAQQIQPFKSLIVQSLDPFFVLGIWAYSFPCKF